MLTRLKDTYNRIARDWHTDHLADDWWIEHAEKFSSLLPAGASVLDVGCAGGVKSKYLAKKGFRVTGIDFSEQFIEIAKKEVPEAEFQVLDIRDIEALNRQFDGIFIQAVLLHFPKDEVAEILSFVLTQLKPGGLIHVSVKEQRPGQKAEEVRTENDYGYSYERFFSYFTSEEIEAILKSLDLDIVHSEVHPSGKTCWIQVIAKKK